MQFFTGLFDSANTWLVDRFGELGPLMAVGGLGVLLCLVALPTLLKKQKDPFRKLREDRTNGNAKAKGGLRQGGRTRNWTASPNISNPKPRKSCRPPSCR